MFKKLLYIGAIVALLAIIALVYATYHYQAIDTNSNNVSQTPTPTPTEQLDQNGNPQSPYGTSTYYSDQGYSFDYPTSLFTQHKGMVNPIYKGIASQISVDEFIHEIPIEHCALSGVCTPTTVNMRFGSTLLDDSIATILKTEFGQSLEKYAVADLSVYEVSQGVEGEGMIYSFIPWQDNKTLFLYRTYIDESILAGYQNAKNFIPLAEQEAIYKKIIGSLD